MKLEEQVIAIIRANTEEKAGVTLASDLRRELRLDSFGTLMVINGLEEAFGITVSEGDFLAVNRVSDIVALLRRKYHCA